MTLNHVYEFVDNKWIKTTPEKAAEKYKTTISASTGIFICRLCGQEVSFSFGKKNAPHFRHIKADDKTCPDRSDISIPTYDYDPSDYQLSLRIKLLDNQSFYFLVGFPSLPPQLMKKHIDNQIIIEEKNSSHVDKYIYNFEKLYDEGITYLKIGNDPSSEYKIHLKNDDEEIDKIWPKYVDSIEDGSIFKKVNGIRIEKTSDIKVGEEYYFLAKRKLDSRKDILIQEIGFGFKNWHLYLIKPKIMSKETVRFFSKYSYFLMNNSSTIQPLWPEFIEYDNGVSHKGNHLYFYYCGSNKVNISNGHKKEQLIKNNQPEELMIRGIYCVNNLTGYQVVTFGKFKVLDHLSLWSSLNSKKRFVPKIIIKDVNQNEILRDTYYRLPPKKCLYITSSFNGYIQTENDGKISFRQDLKANREFFLTNIKYGQTVRIFVGLDCIKSINFQDRAIERALSDKELFDKVNSMKGTKIHINHTFGSLALKMSDYPLTKNWLYRRIMEQEIVDVARDYLLNFFKN